MFNLLEMDNSIDALSVAEKYFRNADHMIFVTYSLLNDVRLFPTVIHDLYEGFIQTLNAILIHDGDLKKGYDSANVRGLIYLAESKVFRKYKISSDFISVIKTVVEFEEAISSSKTHFIRENRFVVCSKNYNLKTIDLNLIKKYNVVAKDFFKKIKEVVMNNEGKSL